MSDQAFNQSISPFFWVQHSHSVSVCLNVDGYQQQIFAQRADEGFEGNGYDWASLAQVFLTEQLSELDEDIHFDPEADMFCAYSANPEALKDFILKFKQACENPTVIADLFSRAELD